MAARWTGFIQTVGFCEIEPFAKKILKKHFPKVPIKGDIRFLRNEGQYGTVDLITGGFPCQPFSIAGNKKGKKDHRDLWPEMFRIIQEFNPTWIVCENVANFVSMAFQRTKTDLESEGYEVQPLIIPACALGAPHRRDRVWILAHTRRKLWEGAIEQAEMGKEIDGGPTDQSERSSEMAANPHFKDVEGQRKESIGAKKKLMFSQRGRWESEPDVGRVANGIPHRVDRLRGLGNSIVPQVAYQILKELK